MNFSPASSTPLTIVRLSESRPCEENLRGTQTHLTRSQFTKISSSPLPPPKSQLPGLGSNQGGQQVACNYDAGDWFHATWQRPFRSLTSSLFPPSPHHPLWLMATLVRAENIPLDVHVFPRRFSPLPSHSIPFLTRRFECSQDAAFIL